MQQELLHLWHTDLCFGVYLINLAGSLELCSSSSASTSCCGARARRRRTPGTCCRISWRWRIREETTWRGTCSGEKLRWKMKKLRPLTDDLLAWSVMISSFSRVAFWIVYMSCVISTVPIRQPRTSAYGLPEWNSVARLLWICTLYCYCASLGKRCVSIKSVHAWFESI